MKEKKEILICIDLAEFSQKIVKVGVKYAKLLEANVNLIRVPSVTPTYMVSDVGFQYLPEAEEDKVLEAEKKHLFEMVEKVKRMGIPCEGILREGIPSDIILEEAKRLDVELIVIGSHGHSTLYQALVGSVCHDVTRETQFPLLLVPDEYKKNPSSKEG